MIRLLVIVSCLLSTVCCLICQGCDSYMSCNNPIAEDCPPRAHCYTLTKRHGQEIVAKGCAHSCDDIRNPIGAHCQICKHENFCNAKEIPIGQGVDVNHGPGIGGGVVYHDNNGYPIGGGVSPRSSSQIFSATVLSLPLVRFFI